MNVGALIALLKLAQDSGFTGPPPTRPAFFPKKGNGVVSTTRLDISTIYGKETAIERVGPQFKGGLGL